MKIKHFSNCRVLYDFCFPRTSNIHFHQIICFLKHMYTSGAFLKLHFLTLMCWTNGMTFFMNFFTTSMFFTSLSMALFSGKLLLLSFNQMENKYKANRNKTAIKLINIHYEICAEKYTVSTLKKILL